MHPPLQIRSPFPPHPVLAEIRYTDLSYGFLLMKQGIASFRVSKADANNRDVFSVGNMVTIDHPLPWVGFITERGASTRDAEVQFLAKDHTYLFERGRTGRHAQIAIASGTLISQTFTEADARGEPPLLVHVDLQNGPPIQYEARFDYLHDFLRALHEYTGWEWGLASVLDQGVRTQLIWEGRIGVDRRTEVIWYEGQHFEEARYRETADGYIGAGLAVGGLPEGTFQDRPAFTVNYSGKGEAGVLARQVARQLGKNLRSPALMGTRIVLNSQVQDAESVRRAAEAVHRTPEVVAEQLSFTLVESMVDTSRLGIGDIVTVRLENADIGGATERQARIIALGFFPPRGTIDVEAQVWDEPV